MPEIVLEHPDAEAVSGNLEFFQEVKASEVAGIEDRHESPKAVKADVQGGSPLIMAALYEAKAKALGISMPRTVAQGGVAV